MKKMLLVALLSLGICANPGFAQNQTAPATIQTIGQNFDGKPILSPGRLTYLLKDQNKKTDLVLSGFITDQGSDQGGWLKMTTQPNSQDEILIKVKPNSFTLPTNLKGKQIVVYGDLIKKAQAGNNLEQSLNNTSSLTGKKEVYVMTITGLKMED